MGVRTYDLLVEDQYTGRPIANALCEAYNITDPANPVLVETQETNGLGYAYFVALPDDAPVDILAKFAMRVKRYVNVFGSGGDDLDSAVAKAHEQNTDLYANGFRTGTSFPSNPLPGEIFYRTDLAKLFKYET